MDGFQLLVGKILPFVTILALIAGLVFRIRRWHKAAVANVALYPAASPDRGTMWRKVLGEIVLFSSFRKEDRQLWLSTWVFHVSLLVIIVGHSRLITDWPLRVLFGMSAASINTLSAWSGGIVGVVALLTCVMLLYRRLTVRRVREASSGEDFLVALLLLAILVTGNMLRFGSPHFDVVVAQAYFQSLFTFTAIQVPADALFLVHFLLVQVLLIYLPFGKLLHIPGVFYSKPLLAKDY